MLDSRICGISHAGGRRARDLRGERGARLPRLVRADDTQVIEAPAVEEFCTEARGSGLRSVRYARDCDG
jgi:hypothetical protein